MTDMMEYKGYVGSVHYSPEDHLFFGKLEYVRALVNYEATDVAELETNFKEAIEDYLKFCQRQGKQPEKPFKGSFNVRISSELHRTAAIYAEEHGRSLNQVVEEALEHH